MNPCYMLTVQKQELHIFEVDLIADSSEALTAALALLSPAEKARGERLYKAELQQRFFIAHAWKRYILSQYCQLSPEELIFTEGLQGKPYLLQSQAKTRTGLLQFNMSHSKDKALF